MARILLTGGAGYIGTHTALELVESGYDVIVADDYSNSCPEGILRVQKITGKSISTYVGDVKCHGFLNKIMDENEIDCVIHLAGYKAVGESVQKPMLYYRNNLDATLTLLECMEEHKIKNLIFSSSATVYGSENNSPYYENMNKGSCTNPYGWTKSMIEQILCDCCFADKDFSAVLLRYFNPVGAHESGLIGEDPQGIPNNLMPFISQVAVGKLDKLTIFGNDYPTPDGTCKRDFIHVVDLAKGHVKAVDYALAHKGAEVFNLGTGNSYSVKEMVDAFERSTGKTIPHVYGARREGDLPECYANVDKATKVLGWKAEKTLDDMCRDTWKWQSMNPEGYR